MAKSAMPLLVGLRRDRYTRPARSPAAGAVAPQHLTNADAERMEFKQGLQLGQRLEQRLVMTQQLQQAIRLLQLSRTELMEAVGDALNENPLLEEEIQTETSQDPLPSALTGGEAAVTPVAADVVRVRVSP